MIAEEMNVSRADVHGVLAVYRDLRRTPGGCSPGRLAAVLADRRAERAAGAQGWERS